MWFFLFFWIWFQSTQSALTSEIMQTCQGLEAHRMDYVLDYLIREKYKVGEFTSCWQLRWSSSSSLQPRFFFFFHTGVFLSNSQSNKVVCSLSLCSVKMCYYIWSKIKKKKKAGLIRRRAPSGLSGREIPGRRLRNVRAASPEKNWSKMAEKPLWLTAALDCLCFAQLQAVFCSVIWKGRQLAAALQPFVT